MKAKFVVVEGVEGVGKSTAIKHIEKYLADKNIKYISVREPGGTELAEGVRKLLKAEYSEDIYPKTEVLLLYAARLQLVENVIKPALNDNIWVICDRHDLSTIAYQSGGRGLDENFIRAIKNSVLGNFTYDLCFYLDLDPKIGLERARGRGELDRIERSGLEFFARVRDKYIELSNSYNNIHTIDASKSIDEVRSDILTTLQETCTIE